MIVWPGLRRCVSAIQRLFNSASFFAPLTHSAIPTRAASGTTGTFTRATTSTWPNNDGYMVTGVAGEIGFPGARRVRNLQATSSEPTSDWTAAGATPPTVTYTTLDGSGAVSMAFPVVAAGYANSRCSGPVNSVSWVQNSTKIATQMVVSLSRALTGSEALTLYLAGASALDDVIVFNASNSPTSAVLQSVVDTFVNPTFSGTMGVMVYVSGAIVGSPVTLSLTRIQFEDVTAQTTQTAGEYVSVGVESAPYYHGSFVDGVKCYSTDINGAAIPSTTLLGYQAEGARTNHFLQSGTPATQTSGSLSTGTYTLWMDGTGSIAVAGATATITGAGTATSASAVTFTVTVAGTVTYTVTGSPTRAQSENGAFRSSYIPTTTIAVTRNADVLTYSSSGNISGTVGAAYAEASVFVGATPSRLLTLNNATQVNALYAGGATVITMYDGTATLNGPANSITADGIARKYASTWNATGLKMRVAASGSLGAEGSFDGDMTPNEIRVGSLYLAGNEWNGTVRNVRIWQRALSSSELQAITS